MLELEVHWEKFDLGEEHYLDMFKPVPAVEVLPDWFKRLSNVDSDNISSNHSHGVSCGHHSSNLTAKTCRGVFDAMASGYMILWPFDVRIEKDESGRLFCYKSRTGDASDFHPHPHAQIDGYPDILLESQRDGVQKLNGPWRMVTPPGTSILMKQPAYRPDLKTEVMEGIIDTDKFYGPMNVLFIIKKINTDRKVIIKAGTPLAQIVPFIRGEWKLTYGKVDDNKKEVFDDLSDNIEKFYQKYHWERKVFKK